MFRLRRFRNLTVLKDYYRLLSVPENASEEEIKRAYRRLAKRYHPDMNAGAVGAEERFKEIAEAYAVLSDPDLRKAYDRKRTFGVYSAPVYSRKEEPKEKKDPRRKEYSEEDLQRARTRYRKRIYEQMRKRRKILVGMAITFVLYLFGAAAFESWIQQRREEQDAQQMVTLRERQQKEADMPIQNLDSPYDKIFGTGRTMWLSPNEIVVYNPVSDAVVCAVQSDTPHQTIRNEFIYAKNAFTMKDLPNGSFYFKVYTGSNWNKKKKVTGGKELGGFMKDEEFFRVMAGPFTLEKPTYKHLNTNTSDTVVIDPTVMKFERISREEFFNPGD